MRTVPRKRASHTLPKHGKLHVHMCVHVAGKVALPTVGLGTVRAFVRLLAHVSQDVTGQRRSPGEGFGAQLALVRLLS